jgi:hypothetical protein
MPICKPSGEEGRALGSGAYAGKNEGVRRWLKPKLAEQS